MLPTSNQQPASGTQQTTDREPIKRDFNDIDSLLRELGTPKEEIHNSPPQPGQSSQQSQLSPYPEDADYRQTISDEVAAASGKMIANTIDTVLGTGTAIYAQSSDVEKYQASPKQLSQLENNWAAIAKKYSYKVEDVPELHVILNSLATYIPKMRDAKHDREMKMIRDDIKIIREELNQLKEDRVIAKNEAAKTTTAPPL